jgi:hypothetical protein
LTHDEVMAALNLPAEEFDDLLNATESWVDACPPDKKRRLICDWELCQGFDFATVSAAPPATAAELPAPRVLAPATAGRGGETPVDAPNDGKPRLTASALASLEPPAGAALPPAPQTPRSFVGSAAGSSKGGRGHNAVLGPLKEWVAATGAKEAEVRAALKADGYKKGRISQLVRTVFPKDNSQEHLGPSTVAAKQSNNCRFALRASGLKSCQGES